MEVSVFFGGSCAFLDASGGICVFPEVNVFICISGGVCVLV